MRRTESSISVKIRSILGITITLMVIGVLFPLLLIEVIAHLFSDLIPAEISSSIFQLELASKVLIPDEELGYKYAPDLVDFPVAIGENGQYTYTISTVSLGYDGIGFRDDGINEGTYAIVVGDSFVNCSLVEIDDCWVELLENRLGKDFANLGVLGYSPQQEYRMLTRYGIPLKPKLVLWVFFANDLKDAWRFDNFGSGAARETEFWQNPANAWLAQNSVVYTTSLFFWYNRHFFLSLVSNDDAVPTDSNVLWWLTSTDLAIDEIAQGLNITQNIILQANKQVYHQDNARLVVVIIPFREQVYTNDKRLRVHFDSVNEALFDFLEQNDIQVTH